MDIVQEIESGKYDDRLQELRTAILRRSTASMVEQASKRPTFRVGDKVRFRATTRPKYMAGIQGTILKVNQKSVKLMINDVNAGRFQGTGTRAPFSLLEHVE